MHQNCTFFRTVRNANLKHVSGWHIFQNGTQHVSVAKSAKPMCRVLLIVVFVIFPPAYIIYAHGHICEVGREKDETDTWMWVLPYPNPCLCTEIIMGGMNTWTPIRPFKPVYASTPLISDDVEKIRKHYNLKCEKQGKNI